MPSADADYGLPPYLQALPYADRIQTEADDWLDKILRNLVVHAKARNFAPGVVIWLRRLNRYDHTTHHTLQEKRLILLVATLT